jgi:hypothetical protein
VSTTTGGWVSGGVVSSTSTQPPSPSWLFPGGVKACAPVLASGEPLTVAYAPSLGSNQRAVAAALSFVMSTVNVRRTGV